MKYKRAIVPSLIRLLSTNNNRISAWNPNMKSISDIIFDNRNIRSLPIDRDERIFSRLVSDAIFSKVAPTPIENPILVSFSPSALSLLGLSDQLNDYGSEERGRIVDFLSGNVLLPGSEPVAHCYCGHQFGSFAGQLGDGAAISLGEVISPSKTGETQTSATTTTTGAHAPVRMELQLKGAGKTPFSRSADGRKVLRSSLREYLASECLFALNIPTTRAGSIVTSKTTTVERDPYYTGHVINEQCSVISRIAPSFFRFGSFEVFKGGHYSLGERTGPSDNNEVLKKQLLDHIISCYYPEVIQQANNNININTNNGKNNSTTNIPEDVVMTEVERESYRLFFDQVVQRTVQLVVAWQAVGFVHGVLNTDNMSILGLTIDYGPYGVMEIFDPQYTPNGSDHGSRYNYSKQPEICKWNLVKLSEVLSPFLSKQDADNIIAGYDEQYKALYINQMRSKLGLTATEQSDDGILINELMDAMEATGADFTETFQALTCFVEELELNHLVSNLNINASNANSTDEGFTAAKDRLLNNLLSVCCSVEEWQQACQRSYSLYQLEMHPQQISMLHTLISDDPATAQRMFGGRVSIDDIKDMITGEKRKMDQMIKLNEKLKTLKELDDETKTRQDRTVWNEWIASYLQRLHSDYNINNNNNNGVDRVRKMKLSNPNFILRNWVAQKVIEAAEKEDNYQLVQTALDMCLHPFDEKYRRFVPTVLNTDISSSTSSSSGNSCGGTNSYVDCSASEKLLLMRPDWATGLVCTCSS